MLPEAHGRMPGMYTSFIVWHRQISVICTGEYAFRKLPSRLSRLEGLRVLSFVDCGAHALRSNMTNMTSLESLTVSIQPDRVWTCLRAKRLGAQSSNDCIDNLSDYEQARVYLFVKTYTLD